ncbi:hypothetical protein OP10G_2764 [Fimbriimonas ginsengisoli Gsoil 348]|uniref:Uncharacterized protein n=1 Tax=Fimbriimonas ginsengisoli Gsoil 348 TaxID=661478 RepID=A0A068NS22_FIMGI|nr:hypothetical protein OP10G_2764 [Fimbriimonas ginsengisoli Gsoil 348]
MEAYVREALLMQLEEDAPIRLTPDQVAIIAQAESDIDAGKGLSIEEVRAELAAHRQKWQAANPR